MDTSQMDVSPTSHGQTASETETDTQSARYELSSFDRFAAICATLAAIIGLFYSISFVIVARSAPALGGLLSALFLMLGGVLGSAALTGIYRRLVGGPAVDKTLALWAFLLELCGALGSFIHGGYDLANALHPPAVGSIAVDLPSQIDPRGLLTFGLAGIGLLVLSTLMARSPNFSRGLSTLGTILGILLVLVYLGRLIILDASNPLVLYTAALTGFLVNPAFYLWLGRNLGRS
jgi:hypothetical protein